MRIARSAVCTLILAATVAVGPGARANEVMTDRCSAEVAFPPNYDGKPNAKNTVILARGANGATPWSEPFTVKTDSDGHIRWWCHSTTGNMFDLGTLRVSGISAGGVAACISAVGATVVSEGASAASLASCLKVLNFGSSAWKGWTPERSRCSDHSTRIRVRLGPDRLLQTECLGK